MNGINALLKSQSSVLDAKNFVTDVALDGRQIGRLQVFDWIEGGQSKHNDNHFDIQTVKVRNLGNGIRNYSCTPLITDNGSAIRAKLQVGNGDLNFTSTIDLTGSYPIITVNGGIEDLAVNALIWVDQTTHQFKVEQINVENFRFQPITYPNVGSSPCCNSLEFTLTWLFGIKNFLNAEIRPRLGEALLRDTFSNATRNHTYDRK